MTPAMIVLALALGAVVPSAMRADEEVNPAQPAIPPRAFSLAAFGAVPDGRTDNTAAFGRAIEAVRRAGGGRLTVPAGVYFTGPVDLCSSLDLHLDRGATVLFSPDPAAYRAGPNHYRPLLEADGAHDVMISGGGTIDGHGEAWWAEAWRFKREARARRARNDTSPRPRMVVFDRCQRVRVEGITLTNAPVFNLVPNGCEDVTVEGVTIVNPADSPNTDGIDPSGSRRVLIAGCRIDTGDDCIAIKAGNPAVGPSEDVLVTDCVFLHGHGCSIGSDTLAGVRRVTVRRCSFDGTDCGVRLKSDRDRGGPVEDILYEDLTMRGVGQAIVISSYYPESTMPKPGRPAAPAPPGARSPAWRRITIRHVSSRDGLGAGFVMGLPESPVTDLTLDHVSIAAERGFRIGYARNVLLRHVDISVAQGPSCLVEDSVAGLRRED